MNISYNENIKNSELFIALSGEFVYGFDFMNYITKMIDTIMNTNCQIIKIYTIEQNLMADKLCLAVFRNVWVNLSKYKKLKWTVSLESNINSKVQQVDGTKFSNVVIEDYLIRDDLNFYCFHGDQGVDEAVINIADFLVGHNLAINGEQLKEFLATTIGEIFSNCINHSEQDIVLLLFDIIFENDELYLYINVIDFGVTLVTNVQNYMSKKGKHYSGIDCVKWAIQNGNTTREGSGGYGLPSLINYIEEVNGELFIFSGDTYYKLSNQKGEIENAKGFFDGTTVTMKVKLFEINNAIKYDDEKQKFCSVSLDDI